MVLVAADKEANNIQARSLCGQRHWKNMSDTAQRKEKQKWAIEKPKLDNERRLRGIYFIDPADVEFKEFLKNARRKFEVPLPAGEESSGRPVALLALARQNTACSVLCCVCCVSLCCWLWLWLCGVVCVVVVVACVVWHAENPPCVDSKRPPVYRQQVHSRGSPKKRNHFEPFYVWE